MRFALTANERRLRDLVVALDHDDATMAETWRLVGSAAANLGLRRPGYHLVRRLVRESRAVRRARAERRLAELAATASLFSPRVADFRVAAERARDARRTEEQVLSQHKRSARRD